MSEEVIDEIAQLKKKICLYEGNHRAHFEGLEWSIKHNKDLLSKLRNDNKELQKQLRYKSEEGDMVLEAFQSVGRKLPPDFRNVTVEQATHRFDQSVAALVKKHNLLQHQLKSHQETQEHLVTGLDKLQMESSELANMDCPEATQLRDLDNKLDKFKIKCDEAQHVQKIYKQIIDKLQEERLTFDNLLTVVEKQIKYRHNDYEDLSGVYAEAVTTSQVAKEDLSVADHHFITARKQREKILEEYRKRVEEQKERVDKIEKRLQRSGTQLSDEMEPLIEQTEAREIFANQQKDLLSYDKAMEVIKDATAVSGIEEVVSRFAAQGETRDHLLKLKKENISQLEQAREEKEKLLARYEDTKYSGETTVSAGELILEQLKSDLDQASSERDKAREVYDNSIKLLNKIRAGIEHLTSKLGQIKAPRPPAPHPHGEMSEAEKFIELLYNCEQKLVSLSEELAGKDLDEIQREIEDQQFRMAIEGKLPGSNVRVKLPASAGYQHEDDYVSDEDVLFSRENAKKATGELLELQNKKKVASQNEDSKKNRKR